MVNAESTLCDVLERIPPAIREKVEEIVVFDAASQDRTYEVGTAYKRRTAQEKLAIHHNLVNLMYGGTSGGATGTPSSGASTSWCCWGRIAAHSRLLVDSRNATKGVVGPAARIVRL